MTSERKEQWGGYNQWRETAQSLVDNRPITTDRLQHSLQLTGILSNPPYIPREQLPGLQAEVGRHEPHLALDGGAGLGDDSLTAICAGAAAMLLPGGFLALETAGGEQAHAVAALLRGMDGPREANVADSTSDAQGGYAFRDVRVVKDLRGVDRFVTCYRC